MALLTPQAHMPAGDFERESIVIEILPQPIHPIVTVNTGGTKSRQMCGHEASIALPVAVIAGVQSECRDVAVMTISAGEWGPRSRMLVAL